MCCELTINREQMKPFPRILIATMVALSPALHSFSQTCNCKELFDFVSTYVEKNNPAYQVVKDDVDKFITYTLALSKGMTATMRADSVHLCLDQVNLYLAALRDHHTRLFYLPHEQAKAATRTNDAPAEFSILSDSISCLKIRSFSRQYVEQLNHFYDSVDAAIRARPWLILDLRDNGGGSDEGWWKLVQYFYQRPLETDFVELWVTDDNLRFYESDKKLSRQLKHHDRNRWYLLNHSDSATFGLKAALPSPRKVLILHNRQTASTAEDFILLAWQSKKVKTFGENTGGYMGYGNVMQVNTPGNLFVLLTTTTRFAKAALFEYEGLRPQVKLNPDQDWIEEVLKFCE